MHENTKAGLLRAETFLNEHADLPDLNVEILNGGVVEIHIHLGSADDLPRVHAALGTPAWRVSLTDTAAATIVDGIPVTIYYSAIRHEPDTEALLRQLGLVSGLSVVKGA